MHRRILWVGGALALLVLWWVASFTQPPVTSQPRATLSPAEETALVPTLTMQAVANTAMVATLTAMPLAETQLAELAPTLTATALTPLPTATCTPGPRCVYLTSIQRPALPTAIPPTPAPTGVYIANDAWWSLGDDDALVGEVVNATNAPVCYARVTARLYNADGVLVATDDRGADLTATLPGQRNPFTVWIYDAPPASRYELSVSADSCYSRYASLTVVSAADRNVNGGVEVFGEVENTGGDAVTSAEVAITYYGADGRVVQTDWDLVSPDDLVLGQRGTYRAVTYVRNLRQLFTRYTITAQARVASGPFVIHKESVRPTRPPVTTEWQRRP